MRNRLKSISSTITLSLTVTPPTKFRINMRLKLLYLSLFCLACSTMGNLDGPFLFFGPKCLMQYKRSALKSLEQDDLMRIYSDQAAIVVFNNQDSVPLSSGHFPRLRKMLEGQTTLILPQDFLDIHPDYISNETQVLTLQGPWGDRDAQMTETFARLQDIYGEGQVLGILGNSASECANCVSSGTWRRVRRGVEESTTPAGDERPSTRSQIALFNATGPPGNGILLYSSRWPELRTGNVSIALDNPIGDPTVKVTRLYTILVIRFANQDANKEKITLELSFKQSGGWWYSLGAEVKRGLAGAGAGGEGALHPRPAPPLAGPLAVLGKAYTCSQRLVYASEGGDETLTLFDVKMQAFMDSTEKFSDAFDCVGFTSVPIWSGLMISFLMLLGLGISITMILDIKTPDRYENNRSKQLTITVNE